MMITRSTRVLVLALAALAGLAHAAQDINLKYRSSGEKDLIPVQIYDDGKKTYFQMKGNVVPAFFAVTNGQETMLPPDRAGDMLTVDAVAQQFVIRFGNLSANVDYIGGDREKTKISQSTLQKTPVQTTKRVKRAPAPPAAHGAVTPNVGDEGTGRPDFIDRDALIPFAKGKDHLSKDAAAKVKLALTGSGAVQQVVVTGRDDATYVEGLARARAMAIRDRIVATGVPVEKVIIKEGLARDAEGSNTITSDMVVTWRNVPDQRAGDFNRTGARWFMSRADMTLSRMIGRWAAAEGWQVQWRAMEDPMIAGDAPVIANSLQEAVENVLGQTRAMGYAVGLYQVTNKTLVIQ